MITAKNLLNHEFIGLKVKVKEKPIKGVIVDETKNTFVIRTDNKDKIVPKKDNEFAVELEAGTYAVKGATIAQKPYERLKRQYKVNNKWEKTLVYKE